MMYLSAQVDQFWQRPDLYGIMLSYQYIGGWKKAVQAGACWMLDNGAFTGKFDFRQWVKQQAELLPYRQNCLGIIVPDVPYDTPATLRRFHQYYAIPQALGYPVAHATQDGMTPADMPWSLFDTLFIGGSDGHKRGVEAERLAMAAKKRGKWVHVGRVSSGYAIAKYWTWADSFDGTTFIYGGKVERYREMTPVLANHGRYVARRFL